MNEINALGLFILFLAVASSAGCSAGSSGSAANDNAAASTSTATANPSASASPASASNSEYPAWAAAAVPNYPNAIDRMLVRHDFYQIDSADDAATVLAWYKSHVSGTWGEAGGPGNQVLPNVNGVRIEVDKLGYGNEPVGSRPRTMICLNLVASGPENWSC
jgi:hypothetical protein